MKAKRTKAASDLIPPVDLYYPSPIPGAIFAGYRIQTVTGDGESFEPYTEARELDEEQSLFYAVYGVGADEKGGELQHIADFEAVSMAQDLLESMFPGIINGPRTNVHQIIFRLTTNEAVRVCEALSERTADLDTYAEECFALHDKQGGEHAQETVRACNKALHQFPEEIRKHPPSTRL